MSLLGVYVIIGYYKNASINDRYDDKITDQKFDMDYVINEVKEILTYRSGPLHWNLAETDKLQNVGNLAINAYKKIFGSYNKNMHNIDKAYERINQIMIDRKNFMDFSRQLAGNAQDREIKTMQPKEQIMEGYKAKIIIKNYLGGEYHFTVDEAYISNGYIYLIEAKNTNKNALPSCSDIKDGLLKMILYTNLSNVYVDDIEYIKKPVLKLTGINSGLTLSEQSLLNKLKKEAIDNGFRILLNGKWIV